MRSMKNDEKVSILNNISLNFTKKKGKVNSKK